jgi:hypothetical protein
MVVVEAILIDIVCRKVVDPIQNQIIIVGLVYAIWS